MVNFVDFCGFLWHGKTVAFMNTPCHSRLMARHVILLTLAMVSLTNCSGRESTHKAIEDNLTQVPEKTVVDSFRAATSPLDDFGLREEEIPQVLKVAMKNPYAGTPKMPCASVRAEMTELNNLLGPDMDATTSSDGNASDGFSISDALTIDEEKIGETIVSHGTDLAHDAVVGFVRSQTSFLPFRGIIRTITGANKHEKEVARAQQAGQLRRAYLKGVMQATGRSKCLVPMPSPATPAIQQASATVAP